jgi:deoxyribose-phosphate aldolase
MMLPEDVCATVGEGMEAAIEQITKLNRAELAAMLDHTMVKAYATQVDISELCEEAARLSMHAVTVNSAWVGYCAKRLEGTAVVVNATVGFPLGASTALIKVQETAEAIGNGAGEIDMVINIGALKSGFPQFVAKEIAAVVKAAGSAPVKVILETGYLSDEEKLAVCRLAEDGGAAFVKTSTGFGVSGATAADVRLMREAVGEQLGVKAAGGIRTYRDALAMIQAGASRLGTSSGVEILADARD